MNAHELTHRIAELEREIAELEATNTATPTWGAAVGALCEIIKGRHAELSRLRISRLRNEPSLRYDNPAPDASAPSVPLGSVRNATLTAARDGRFGHELVTALRDHNAAVVNLRDSAADEIEQLKGIIHQMNCDLMDAQSDAQPGPQDEAEAERLSQQQMDEYERRKASPPQDVRVTDAMVDAFDLATGNSMWKPMIREGLEAALAQSYAGRDNWQPERDRVVAQEYAERFPEAQSDAQPEWNCATQGCKNADTIEGLTGCAVRYRAKIEELKDDRDSWRYIAERGLASGLIEAAEWHEEQAKQIEEMVAEGENSALLNTANMHRNYAVVFRSRAGNRSGK